MAGFNRNKKKTKSVFYKLEAFVWTKQEEEEELKGAMTGTGNDARADSLSTEGAAVAG